MSQAHCVGRFGNTVSLLEVTFSTYLAEFLDKAKPKMDHEIPLQSKHVSLHFQISV